MEENLIKLIGQMNGKPMEKLAFAQALAIAIALCETPTRVGMATATIQMVDAIYAKYGKDGN